jgi:single-stranded-DNA-specific exonuclease
MGRLASAMDSLRLICTTDKKRADNLAALLSKTNFERQQITIDALTHAKNKVEQKKLKNLIFIADESYQQGIVGLVAGRLVEEYYFPSIVISKGEKYSKASARSVKGFNIIEFLRTASDLLVDVGGHPMAAGFTVETDKIEILEKKLYEEAAKLIKKKHLERSLRIDVVLPENFINLDVYSGVQKLAPFGMANPEPTFLTQNLIIEEMRSVGNNGQHLKLKLTKDNLLFEAIAFGTAQKNEFRISDSVDVVYSMNLNQWKGNKKIELKIKDIRKTI